MSDWAAERAAAIVDAPGILQVWPRAGFCRKCNQPIAGAMTDLSALKAAIADALRTALATARNDALDEAARLCDEKGFRARAAILALITKPTIEGGKPKAEKDPDT